MDCMALSKWIRWLYFHGLGGSATMEYSIKNELIGGISEENAVKCFEQIIAMLDSDEKLNLPFITVNGKCCVATKKRLIKCSKNMFGYKFKEWNWSQITNVFYKTTLTTGTLILNTVDGEVKISINRGGINVNLKMYSFDHLRMYNIDHINTCCSRR